MGIQSNSSSRHSASSRHGAVDVKTAANPVTLRMRTNWSDFLVAFRHSTDGRTIGNVTKEEPMEIKLTTSTWTTRRRLRW